MGRAPCCDKTNVKKGPWSSEEDATLKEYIEKYGTGGNWIALPQKIGLKRCGKSCRLRWLNYLRPNIKHGGFSEEEDNTICNLYISIGSRWSIIAAQLPGRTDNDIKNYWNTRLKKKLLGRRKQWISGQNKDETLSNSAIERLQLYSQLQNPNFSQFPMRPCNQEKMMPSVELVNESSNPLIMQPAKQSNNPLQQSMSNMMIINEMRNSVGISIPELSSIVPESDGTELKQYWAFQAEIDELLSNKGATSLDGPHMSDFYSYGAAKHSMSWWSDDFVANSASSNSYDSTGVLDNKETHMKYQEFSAWA